MLGHDYSAAHTAQVPQSSHLVNMILNWVTANLSSRVLGNFAGLKPLESVQPVIELLSKVEGPNVSAQQCSYNS